MIGRFLEISVYASDIKESLEFYETLGFAQASVGEAWEHPYAVVSDGCLMLGLHERQISSPTLTFVRPGLAEHLWAIEAWGIELDYRRTGDEHFNEAGFRDVDGHRARMLEARTYSPPAFQGRDFSKLGRFDEFGLPARNPEDSSEFWEPLGFAVAGQGENPVPFRRLAGEGIRLGFYETREFREPVMVFKAGDDQIEALRTQGYDFRRGFADIAGSSATLSTPEGMTILLLSEES